MNEDELKRVWNAGLSSDFVNENQLNRNQDYFAKVKLNSASSGTFHYSDSVRYRKTMEATMEDVRDMVELFKRHPPAREALQRELVNQEIDNLRRELNYEFVKQCKDLKKQIEDLKVELQEAKKNAYIPSPRWKELENFELIY